MSAIQRNFIVITNFGTDDHQLGTKNSIGITIKLLITIKIIYFQIFFKNY